MCKNRISILFSIIALLLCINIHGQTLTTHINTIASSLETVEAAKLQYSQTLTLNSTNYSSYTLTEVDAKGKTDETVYRFSFSDVDINTVRHITKNDVILVQLLIKGKQKLIKKASDNGDKVSYEDHVFLYAKNIDNGRLLVEAIKKTIPINETLEKNKLALKTYEDHKSWLKNNIQSVDYNKTQIIQKIETDGLNNGHLKLITTINAKSKTSNYEYEFNLATINPNSLIFKINSDAFFIEASNRRNIKAIKVFKDGVQQVFTNKVRLYCDGIENAKDIYKVLKQIIPLVENAFLKTKPKVSSTTEAYKYLSSILKNVTANNQTYTQSFEGDCISKVIIKETNPKETIEKEFSFNFGDINSDNIDFNAVKNQLYVEINTRKKAKFIRYKKNGTLQNYTNTFRVYVNHIEEAMIVKEALQNIAKNCENTNSQTNFNTVSSALETLRKEVTLVRVGNNSYDQHIEVVKTSPYIIKVTSVFSNLKNSKETIYEFGLGDINPKNIAIVTSGKYAMVELNTKHLEKIIKTYQNGAIKSYAFKISMQSTDIENARAIANLLKYITLKSQ